MSEKVLDPETPSTLQQLEPSPIEETPKDVVADGYFPSTGASSSSDGSKSTNFLGLGNHGLSWYLTRTQRYSTYAFSAFALMHITNTSIIPLITQSVAQSESYLLLTRPYYQNRPFEPLLIGIPLVVHIGSGLGLRLLRRRAAGKRFASNAGHLSLSERKKLWPPVSPISATGFASIFLVGGHAIINRAVPLWTEGSSANVGLEYVAHGISKHPVLARIGFAALVWTAVFHMTWGGSKWLGLTPQQVTSASVKEGDHVELVKKRRMYTINGIAVAIVALWMAGGMGVVGRNGPAVGWVAAVYDGMYENIPIFGRWY